MRSFRVPDFPNEWMLARISIMALWNLSALFGAWLLFGSEELPVLGIFAAAFFLFFPMESFVAYLLGVPFVDLLQKPRNATKKSPLVRFLGYTGVSAVIYGVKALIEHPVTDLSHAISFLMSIPFVLIIATAMGALFALASSDEQRTGQHMDRGT